MVDDAPLAPDARELFTLLCDDTCESLWATNVAGDLTFCEGEALPDGSKILENARENSVFSLFAELPEARDCLERALAGKRAQGHFTRQGDFHLTVIPRADGDRVHGVLGLTRRVDKRKTEASDRVMLLRQALASAPIHVWVADREHRFLLFEGGGIGHMGFVPGQLVGMSGRAVFSDRPDLIANVDRGLAGETFSDSIQVGGRVLEVLYAPLRGPDGQVTALFGLGVDVTERERVAEAREQLQAQLLHTQKLDSLGVLAGGIAHDFNNMLTAILGSASAALHLLPPENITRPFMNDVMVAAHRAAHLTRQLLAYSGKGHFEVRSMDLSAHVRELSELLETSISKKVQVRLELDDALPSIEADVAQVQQIVMNLVLNGAEAIGEQSGTVLVTTGVQQVDERMASSFLATGPLTPGPYVFVEVHDTGSGMDDATLARIFDPFFSTKFTGRGLGLAAVLGIVRAHRGGIRVYSTKGRGTTFKVLFPAASSPVAPSSRPSVAFQGQGLALVIDDDPGVRHTASVMLQLLGFRVIEAVHGRDGVEMFERHAAELALVMLDMTMPELSGEEVFREIRKLHTDVPVLLMSGYNEIEATRRFTAKGLAGFLQKPFTLDGLAERLHAAFAKP